jgi:uncharacterized protein (UPF0332 family)
VNAEELWGKAQRAAISARLLLTAGDTSGACNRAYYAMFDAARAALLASGAGVSSEMGKTHSGLIHAFSQHLVKTARVPKELGQSLARAHELRLIADYTGDQVQAIDAQAAVERAEQFIAALKASPP